MPRGRAGSLCQSRCFLSESGAFLLERRESMRRSSGRGAWWSVRCADKYKVDPTCLLSAWSKCDPLPGREGGDFNEEGGIPEERPSGCSFGLLYGRGGGWLFCARFSPPPRNTHSGARPDRKERSTHRETSYPGAKGLRARARPNDAAHTRARPKRRRRRRRPNHALVSLFLTHCVPRAAFRKGKFKTHIFITAP